MSSQQNLELYENLFDFITSCADVCDLQALSARVRLVIRSGLLIELSTNVSYHIISIAPCCLLLSRQINFMYIL